MKRARTEIYSYPSLVAKTVILQTAHLFIKREPLAEKISLLYEKRAEIKQRNEKLLACQKLLSKARAFSPSPCRKELLREKMAEIRLLLAEEFERKGVKLFNDYYSQERRHYQEEVFENMFLSDYSAKEPAKLNINAISQRISKMRGVFDAGIYHATAALLYLSAAETLPRSEKSNSQIISAYEKAEKSLFAASLIFKNALCLPDSFALRLLEPIGIKVRVGSVEEIKKDIQVKLRLFDFQPAPPSEK